MIYIILYVNLSFPTEKYPGIRELIFPGIVLNSPFIAGKRHSANTWLLLMTFVQRNLQKTSP